ncbi:26S proteasome non-ATPase regulatory subunit 1 homolog A [Tanacetum coccineum]
MVGTASEETSSMIEFARNKKHENIIRRVIIYRYWYCVASYVKDDVKRSVVLAIRFVMCSEPVQTLQILSLLSTSYNPHMRYGAAMAVCISCAGDGLSEAISLLEPLTSDNDGFVRQGAYIAMSMVTIQTSEAIDSHVGAFRSFYNFTTIHSTSGGLIDEAKEHNNIIFVKASTILLLFISLSSL